MTASTHRFAPVDPAAARAASSTGGGSMAPDCGTGEPPRTSALGEPSSADLGDLFHTAFRGLRRKWAHQLAPFDVTPHQWRALNTLAGHGQPGPADAPAGPLRPNGPTGPAAHGGCAPAGGTLRLKELAERLRIVPRSATEVVDQLEAKSLVARLPDPSDRRATLIVLTDAGAGLRAKVLAVRREQSDEFFSRLSGADRRELGRLLELLGTHEDCP